MDDDAGRSARIDSGIGAVILVGVAGGGVMAQRPVAQRLRQGDSAGGNARGVVECAGFVQQCQEFHSCNRIGAGSEAVVEDAVTAHGPDPGQQSARHIRDHGPTPDLTYLDGCGIPPQDGSVATQPWALGKGSIGHGLTVAPVAGVSLTSSTRLRAT